MKLSQLFDHLSRVLTGLTLSLFVVNVSAQNYSRIVPWSTPTYNYTVQSDIIYGQGEIDGGGSFADLKLDLYIPDVIPPVDSNNQFPLMLIIHGGGFINGDKAASNFVAYAKGYVKRGWMVASINYRLLGENPVPSSRVQALQNFIGSEATTFQEGAIVAVDDTLKALDFLQSRDDVFAPWTVLFGSSAGSITSLVAGYALDDHDIARPPMAAVLNNWGGMFGFADGTPFDGPTGSDPVLMIVHGTADPTVPFTEATDLQTWANAAGLPLDFQPLVGVGHTTNLLITNASTGVTLFQRSIDYLHETVFLGLEQGHQPPLPPGC